MKKTIFFVAVIALTVPFIASADGMYIPRDYSTQDVYEPSQMALIQYDSGQEDLYLKVNYEGNTNNFVWIIPTPALPKADKAPSDLFEELSALTQPTRQTLGVEENAPSDSAKSGGIIVHEQKQVGIYSITILSATKNDNIYQWLQDNGYKVSPEAKDLLDWYVGKEWYFTAVKVDPEELMKYVEYEEGRENFSGVLTPLKLSFSTESIVYPLKISQGSAKDDDSKSVEVLLYILAKHQVKAPAFGREYNQAVNPGKLESEEKRLYDSDFNSLKGIITQEYFLTKLRRRTFAKSEMDEDLYFIDVNENEQYRGISTSEKIKLTDGYNGDTRYKEQIAKVRGMAIIDRLRGRIVLRVEANGEAYYINPVKKIRRYLGRANDAFAIMREEGVGITNANLNKIPIAISHVTGPDTDNDGLTDALENALGTNPNDSDSDNDGNTDKTEVLNGYNPRGSGRMPISLNFSKEHAGKIFLQVQNKGEAWYINPVDGKRYFLGRPADAYGIMRTLGLGISEADFQKM